MVMTFAGCACSLENVMIRNSYGSTAYGVALFTLASWFALTVHDGSKGNPCGNMISFMQGKISLPMMWVRVFFQLLGGLASYTYARNFWYLGLTKVTCHFPGAVSIFPILVHKLFNQKRTLEKLSYSGSFRAFA